MQQTMKTLKATSFTGVKVQNKPRAVRAAPVNAVVRASANEATSRRAALSAAAGAAAVLAAKPSLAAYGERANVFGGAKGASTDFFAFSGDGYTLDLPGKWNPSKEVEIPGTVMRYEDNYDTVSSLLVSKTKAKGGSIKDYGSVEACLDFLTKDVGVLGKQAYSGNTASEGGFAANKVSTAALVSANAVEKGGKLYYKYELLTRTADGDEGGRHQLISAAVGGGNLYIFKTQMGEKRWVKGGAKDPYNAWNSFTVTA